MFRTTSLVVIATICSVAFAEDGLGFGMPLIGTDAMKNLHLNSSQRVLVNGNDLMSTVELIRDMTNEVRSLRNRLARHTRSKSPTNSPSTLSPTNSPTNSVPTNSPTTSEPTASTTLSPTNSPTTSAPTPVGAPTCVYAGTTTWSQSCTSTSTDDFQDASMKTACEGAYGNGAYSASYNQLVEGKIQGLPTTNPSGLWLVFSLPEPDVCNGHRADHSTCEPRNCVAANTPFPTTCGLDIGWTYNCHTGTRSTVCCSPP
eukprot:m.91321 g.91321  ORF g.91321 m.91321 type:complete len:258 (-) comp26456_c0_seq9:94-867(-)